MWRRTSLRTLNVVLYAAIAIVALWRWDDVRWGASELPEYVQGEVGTPLERTLYLEAGELIRDGGDLSRARALLERSIEIDPYSDAVYWLGEYHVATGDAAAGLAAFERYLSFDATRLDAYLRAAELLADLGRLDEARGLLARGAARFSVLHERASPRLDPGVDMAFNEKAVGVYGYYGGAAEALSRRLRELESSAAPGARKP